jgi:hypothetical protein
MLGYPRSRSLDKPIDPWIRKDLETYITQEAEEYTIYLLEK